MTHTHALPIVVKGAVKLPPDNAVEEAFARVHLLKWDATGTRSTVVSETVISDVSDMAINRFELRVSITDTPDRYSIVAYVTEMDPQRSEPRWDLVKLTHMSIQDYEVTPSADKPPFIIITVDELDTEHAEDELLSDPFDDSF